VPQVATTSPLSPPHISAISPQYLPHTYCVLQVAPYI